MASVKENQHEVRGGPDGSAARAAIENSRRLLQAGDADAAVAAIRPYATRADTPPAELADVAKLMVDAGSPVDGFARYLEAGRGFLDAGDIGQARQSLAAAYGIDGKNMDALFELGRVDVADGKKHDALDKFVEVLRKSNLKHLPALFEAGCLYELDGQHNQAILAFKRVVERDKTHVSAFEHLGGLHQMRNQLQDAVASYVRGSEAAHARFQYPEAKRLAEAALAIDGGNANAQRLAAEAEKAVVSGSKPPPAATASPQAAPEQRSVQSETTVSDVTPITPPSAEGPVPPPPPSTLNMNLPSDVALLEQQSQAMAQLAQVQNAVAQTYRQRMALDEEIKKAQAALESLHRQQESVDEDLSGKRDELAKIVADREAEEFALAELGDAIAKSKRELETLGSLPATIGDIQAKCAATLDLAAKAAADVDGVANQSKEVGAKTAAVNAQLAELQAKLASARQAADAIERQMSDVASQAQSAQGVTAAAATAVDQTKAALESLASERKAIEAASADLSQAAKNVEIKREEASAAIKRLEALQAQRKSQFEEIVLQLTPLVGNVAVAPSTAPAPPSASPSPNVSTTSPSASPAPPSNTLAGRPASPPAESSAAAAAQSVDALIAGGKFSEAAQRAQNDANARPKPAEYLVEVGSKLRAAGKLDEAAKLFASARDRDQSSGRARYELGSVYGDMGRVDEALALLAAIENDPEYAVLGQVAIGKCLRRKGDLEAAEARFSKALEIEGRPDEDYHQALYQLADLHESKGDPESLGLALWSYEELQTGNPKFGDVAQRVAKLKAQLADAGAKPEPTRNGAVKQ